MQYSLPSADQMTRIPTSFFHNSEKYGWKQSPFSEGVLSYKGDIVLAEKVLQAIRDGRNPSTCLSDLAQQAFPFLSFVFEDDTSLIGFVDHVRAWPLFWSHQQSIFHISADVQEVLKQLKTNHIEQSSLLEFKMSGYVSGDKTLYQDVFCMLPGEYIQYNKVNHTLEKVRYDSYVPSYPVEGNIQEYIDRLSEIIDHSIDHIIARADGRPIWVPLSAGLDSRIILCKLVEKKYPDLHTFTYGPRFNFEALHAKKIAKKLGVDWRFVAIGRKTLRRYFESQERKDFWKYADGLKTIPCMREYAAIRYLHEHVEIPHNAIIINGQSGDYITGGHIPESITQTGIVECDDFLSIVMNKHYDQWVHFKTMDNLNTVRQSILALVSQGTSHTQQHIESSKDNLQFAQYHEVWEYIGRQCCYVVNGQRIYEYLGYDWEMPLWEKPLCDFCKTLPINLKHNQALYKTYLKQYNFKGLFPANDPYIWRWPLPFMWVVPIAQVIGWMGGKEKKQNFYARMKYFGHYNNQYSFFSFKQFLSVARVSRNVISLYIKQWLLEKNITL